MKNMTEPKAQQCQTRVEMSPQMLSPLATVDKLFLKAASGIRTAGFLFSLQTLFLFISSVTLCYIQYAVW